MKDPVCGMDLTPENAAGSKEWQGETYFFCSQHCVAAFGQEPASYAGKARAIPGEVKGGAMAGVLIKNADALEILEKMDTLVVDKTGTLTEGRPRLVSIVALPDQQR